MNPNASLKAVDAVDVVVLVDNVTDILSSVPDSVLHETAMLRRAGMPALSGEAKCCPHFGLSLVITARVGATDHTLLFDAGPEGYVIRRNGEKLGVDFGKIEATVLSHGHWDHAGGFLEALDLISSANGGKDVPCYVNPGMFKTRALRLPDGDYLPFKEIPSPAELSSKGAQVINSEESRLLLDDTFYLSGEIPRITDYERGLPGHMQRSADGQSWEPDPWIMDERYLATHVKDKGIVVFTACSHAGVVNVLRNAQTVFADAPLYAVMGGFHLAGKEIEPIIADTVADIDAFGLRRIVPGHCTGWRAVSALANSFDDQTLVPCAVGRQYRF